MPPPRSSHPRFVFTMDVELHLVLVDSMGVNYGLPLEGPNHWENVLVFWVFSLFLNLLIPYGTVILASFTFAALSLAALLALTA
jgi:hypothetical protein